jgi:hypothetical protein
MLVGSAQAHCSDDALALEVLVGLLVKDVALVILELLLVLRWAATFVRGRPNSERVGARECGQNRG